MNTTTYREELEKLDIGNNRNGVSNYIINIFHIIKTVNKVLERGPEYITFITKDKDHKKTLTLLNILKTVLDDNCLLFADEAREISEKISKYIELINNNLDSVIRSNPNIIYDSDEDSDDEKNPEEININCDMINETFTLITNLKQLIELP